MKYGTCGGLSMRMCTLSPLTVTAAEMVMSPWPWPASSSRARPWYVPSGIDAISERMCRSAMSFSSAMAACTVASPYLASSARRWRSPTRQAPYCAFRSPSWSRRARILHSSRLITSSRRTPRSQSLTGGIRSPSAYRSRASGLYPAGTGPPISVRWPLQTAQNTSSPSWNTGLYMQQSRMWLPW